MKYTALMMLSVFLAACKSVLLPRICSVEDFANYSIYYQYVVALLPVVSLGLLDGYLLSYGKKYGKNSQNYDEYREAFTTTILIAFGLLVVFSLVVSALEIYGAFFELYIASSCFSQLLFFWYLKTIRFELRSIGFASFSLIRILIDLILIFSLGVNTVEGLVLSEVISHLITLTLLVSYYRMKLPALKVLSTDVLHIHLRSGCFLALSALVAALLLVSDKLLVSVFFEVEEVAEYNLYFLVFLPYMAVFNIVQQYYLPKLNALDDAEIMTYVASVKSAFYLYVLGMLFSALVLLILFPFFAAGFYGYELSLSVVFCVALAAIFMVLNVFEIFLVSRGKFKLVFKINFNALVFELVVLFSLLIAEQYSLLVYGVLAARLFILLSCYWHYKKSALLYDSNGAAPL